MIIMRMFGLKKFTTNNVVTVIKTQIVDILECTDGVVNPRLEQIKEKCKYLDGGIKDQKTEM